MTRVALERFRQTVGMSVLEVALHPLRAQLPLVEREVVPGLETDDLGRIVPRTGSADPPATIPIPSPEERTAMKPTLPPPTPPSDPNAEALDPLVEAEGLRAALADVAEGATAERP